MGMSSLQRPCLKVFSLDAGHALREAEEGVQRRERENRPRAWGGGLSVCLSRIHPSFQFCLPFLHKHKGIMKAKNKKIHQDNCINNSVLNLYDRSFSSQ